MSFEEAWVRSGYDDQYEEIGKELYNLAIDEAVKVAKETMYNTNRNDTPVKIKELKNKGDV